LRLVTKIILLFSFSLPLVGIALADNTTAEAPRLLPAQIGKLRMSGRPSASSLKHKAGVVAGETVPVAYDGAEYTGANGTNVLVEIVRLRQDSQAYELLTLKAAFARQNQPGTELGTTTGTAGYRTKSELVFFKGVNVVEISNLAGTAANLDEIAQSISESLDKGEGDIPALIKHLPSPEEAQKTVMFLSSFEDLGLLEIQPPVFTAIASGGNADAAFASYGPSKVLIVEFNTPQLAADNDKRIIARIQELWKLGQPAPTAYRRVGNYSVFVFDAPDEQTAKQLIDQVKYEQVVQWLGENPNILKEAERRYINTTLGVLVAVLKASGYALVLCLGMGGLIGGLLFSYRRSQQREVTAFSDAGGMLRLNLDELSAETNASRLLRERN